MFLMTHSHTGSGVPHSLVIRTATLLVVLLSVRNIPSVANSKLTLYGPVNWLSPANMRGGFCEGAPFGAYHWRTKEATQLVIAALKTDVKCPDRDSVFTGTWSRA